MVVCATVFTTTVFPFSGVLEGCSMEYNEVSSTFSTLVETHFLQRCPPVARPATTATAALADAAAPTTSATPAATVSMSTPESFPDCYRVPHVTLIGRGKRRCSSEDGEDQRNVKKPKLDAEVGVLTQCCDTNVPKIKSSLLHIS